MTGFAAGKNKRAGFTLIEVMITVIILTVGIISVIRGYIVSLNAFRVSQDYLSQVSLAESKLLEIKQGEIEEGGLAVGVSQGRFPGGFASFNWELEVLASDNKKLNIAKVTVFKEKVIPARKFSLVSFVKNK
jgi:prepilin-type N-terminal cleavage/methylation domain-containing protein